MSDRKTTPLPSILDHFEVSTAFDWYNIARPRILKMLAENEYGYVPPRPEAMKAELLREVRKLAGGTARRREYGITLCNAGKEFYFEILVYSPEDAAKPILASVAALNFCSNAGVMEEDGTPFDENARKGKPGRWPIKQLMEAGFIVATAARNDIYFDDTTPESRKNSIFKLFGDIDGSDRHFTAVSAWAFGYRTICNFLLTLPEVDPKRIWFHGHSRLGKTALWAAANDPRAAGVVSNDSGCCGAAISRDKEGETVQKIVTRFPHWFVPEFDRYMGNEAAMPWDQHYLVSLSAPRPVLVASASEDQWAYPPNEFRAAVASGEVYRLFGVPGIEEGTAFPPPDTPILRKGVGYYMRTGIHGVFPYDWEQVAAFIRLNTPQG